MKRIVFAFVSFALFSPFAQAADLDGYEMREREPYRGAVIQFYDVEPGTVLRAYWATPWDNRHYFPATGKLPRYGRAEDLNAPRRQHVRAESFYREWGASSDRRAAPADVEPVPYYPGVAPITPDADRVAPLK